MGRHCVKQINTQVALKFKYQVHGVTVEEVLPGRVEGTEKRIGELKDKKTGITPSEQQRKWN